MILYATWWQWIIALIVYLINAASLTVTLHRYVSHGSWKCNKWVERILITLSTIGVIGSALSWAAIHGKHHRYEDTPQDPHSPTYKGFAGIWLLMLTDTDMRYVTKLLRKRLYRWQHDYYFAIILVYAILLFVISPFAVVYAFLCPAALYWLGGVCLNYYGHDENGPKNSNFLKVIMLGDGYHKNHHNNPSLKKFGKYDVGGMIVQLLEKKA